MGIMITIAILADVHANLPAMQAVLADAEMRECSRIYHAGDLISIGPYPAEVVDLAMSANLIAVQGNHEQWIGSGLPLDPIPEMSDEELQHQHWTHSRLDRVQKDYIRAMPFDITETLEGVRLRMVHFAFDQAHKSFMHVDFKATDIEILSLFEPEEEDIVCFGHLHNRLINQPYRGSYFLNPGAAGCNHKSVAPYATVTIQDNQFTVERYQVPYDRGALLARYDQLEIPARETIRKIFYGSSS
jgi:putative phosphoesterase